MLILLLVLLAVFLSANVYLSSHQKRKSDKLPGSHIKLANAIAIVYSLVVLVLVIGRLGVNSDSTRAEMIVSIGLVFSVVHIVVGLIYWRHH
jgi:protein-S-isoprenylcysteine O-methyltransferase Ste14